MDAAPVPCTSPVTRYLQPWWEFVGPDAAANAPGGLTYREVGSAMRYHQQQMEAIDKMVLVPLEAIDRTTSDSMTGSAEESHAPSFTYSVWSPPISQSTQTDDPASFDPLSDKILICGIPSSDCVARNTDIMDELSVIASTFSISDYDDSMDDSESLETLSSSLDEAFTNWAGGLDIGSEGSSDSESLELLSATFCVSCALHACFHYGTSY